MQGVRVKSYQHFNIPDISWANSCPRTAHSKWILLSLLFFIAAISDMSAFGQSELGSVLPATDVVGPSPVLSNRDSANTSLPGNAISNSTLSGAYLPEETNAITVYEKCNRSVVHIATRSVAMDSFLQAKLREGSGSGSVLNREGLILTNHHVVDGAREITVSLYDGSSYAAAIVGQDPDTDIALLKIEAQTSQLNPVEWGDSEDLRVGQRIYAIGNPFGLERTMSTGMISSLNRQIPSQGRRTMRSLIQIDASLNQGNSGGPLLNTRGQLIGMNTAIMSSDGDSAGVGFAIPSQAIQRITNQLLRFGKVIRPTIGITRVYEVDNGLLVVTVAKGGPAEKAGVQGFSVVTKTFRQGPYKYEQNSIDPSTADRILAADGQAIRTSDDLLGIVESKKPGDSLMLDVVREGKQIQVPIVLGESE